MATEQQHAISVARAAIEKIKKYKLPATPQTFEFWFLYASGESPSLTRAVDDLLFRKGELHRADFRGFYTRFIGPDDVSERIGTVGVSVDREIGEIADAVDEVRYATRTYGEDLAEASKSLVRFTRSEEVKDIVGVLAESVTEFRRINAELEDRLGSSKQQIKKLKQNLKGVQLEAQTDPLTRVLNRRTFDTLLPEQLARARERQEPICLLMMDIDHFREFNNRWGHLLGDQVLRLVASSVRASVKGKDFVARFGGEEFAVILPETTLGAACIVAEQVRRVVASKHVRNRNADTDLGRLTLSIGVAQANDSDTTDALIARADSCLYVAKNDGRNRCVNQTELRRK